ncbi:hypothetical protein SNEBB_002267 [Seison nebaliae]|nr:hypothetical protein SNEBB_002267 [Seison nebaliae]
MNRHDSFQSRTYFHHNDNYIYERNPDCFIEIPSPNGECLENRNLNLLNSNVIKSQIIPLSSSTVTTTIASYSSVLSQSATTIGTTTTDILTGITSTIITLNGLNKRDKNRYYENNYDPVNGIVGGIGRRKKNNSIRNDLKEKLFNENDENEESDQVKCSDDGKNYPKIICSSSSSSLSSSSTSLFSSPSSSSNATIRITTTSSRINVERSSGSKCSTDNNFHGKDDNNNFYSNNEYHETCPSFSRRHLNFHHDTIDVPMRDQSTNRLKKCHFLLNLNELNHLLQLSSFHYNYYTSFQHPSAVDDSLTNSNRVSSDFLPKYRRKRRFISTNTYYSIVTTAATQKKEEDIDSKQFKFDNNNNNNNNSDRNEREDETNLIRERECPVNGMPSSFLKFSTDFDECRNEHDLESSFLLVNKIERRLSSQSIRRLRDKLIRKAIDLFSYMIRLIKFILSTARTTRLLQKFKLHHFTLFAVNKRNEMAQLFLQMGHWHLLIEEHSAALESYQNALDYNPLLITNSSLLYGLIIVYFILRSYNWMMKLFKLFLHYHSTTAAIHPFIYSDIFLKISLIYRQRRQFDGSRRYLMMALQQLLRILTMDDILVEEENYSDLIQTVHFIQDKILLHHQDDWLPSLLLMMKDEFNIKDYERSLSSKLQYLEWKNSWLRHTMFNSSFDILLLLTSSLEEDSNKLNYHNNSIAYSIYSHLIETMEELKNRKISIQFSSTLARLLLLLSDEHQINKRKRRFGSLFIKNQKIRSIIYSSLTYGMNALSLYFPQQLLNNSVEVPFTFHQFHSRTSKESGKLIDQLTVNYIRLSSLLFHRQPKLLCRRPAHNQCLNRSYKLMKSHLDKALQIIPKHRKLMYLYGRCLTMEKSNGIIAFRNFSEAINYGYTATMWCAIGNLYHTYLQCNDALSAYIYSVNVDESFLPAWYNAGLLYEMTGQILQAIQCYQKCLMNFKSFMKKYVEEFSQSIIITNFSQQFRRLHINQDEKTYQMMMNAISIPNIDFIKRRFLILRKFLLEEKQIDENIVCRVKEECSDHIDRLLSLKECQKVKLKKSNSKDAPGNLPSNLTTTTTNNTMMNLINIKNESSKNNLNNNNNNDDDDNNNNNNDDDDDDNNNDNNNNNNNNNCNCNYVINNRQKNLWNRGIEKDFCYLWRNEFKSQPFPIIHRKDLSNNYLSLPDSPPLSSSLLKPKSLSNEDISIDDSTSDDSILFNEFEKDFVKTIYHQLWNRSNGIIGNQYTNRFSSSDDNLLQLLNGRIIDYFQGTDLFNNSNKFENDETMSIFHQIIHIPTNFASHPKQNNENDIINRNSLTIVNRLINHKRRVKLFRYSLLDYYSTNYRFISRKSSHIHSHHLPLTLNHSFQRMSHQSNDDIQFNIIDAPYRSQAIVNELKRYENEFVLHLSNSYQSFSSHSNNNSNGKGKNRQSNLSSDKTSPSSSSTPSLNSVVTSINLIDEKQMRENLEKSIYSVPFILINYRREFNSGNFKNFVHQQPVLLIKGLVNSAKINLSMLSAKSIYMTNSDQLIRCRRQRHSLELQNFLIKCLQRLNIQKFKKSSFRPKSSSINPPTTNNSNNITNKLPTFSSTNEMSEQIKYCQFYNEQCQSTQQIIDICSKGNNLKNRKNSQQQQQHVLEKNTIEYYLQNNLLSQVKEFELNSQTLLDFKKLQTELNKFPSVFQWQHPSNLFTLTSNLPGLIRRIRPTITMTTIGTIQPLSQSPMASSTFFINIGPADIMWTVIPAAYSHRFQQITNEIDCLNGNYFVTNFHNILRENCGIYTFLQKPGECLWLQYNAVYSWLALGVTHLLSWNLFSMNERQIDLMLELERYRQFEFIQSFNEYPFKHFIWIFAINLKMRQRNLFLKLKRFLLLHLRSMEKEVKWTKNESRILKIKSPTIDLSNRIDNILFCNLCQSELFHLAYFQSFDNSQNHLHSYLQQAILLSATAVDDKHDDHDGDDDDDQTCYKDGSDIVNRIKNSNRFIYFCHRCVRLHELSAAAKQLYVIYQFELNSLRTNYDQFQLLR